MSVIRQDPTTKEWVILATERGKRPHDFRSEKRESISSLPSRIASCPFCIGNESLTPPEILRIGKDESSEWAVRVFPNKFAALSEEGDLKRREFSALFREIDGVGFHEVIVETPHHNRLIPFMDEEEVFKILRAYQSRYQALKQDWRIRYLIIFKNHGEAAGTSLEHPHSQLVATPVPPMLLRRKYEVAVSHYDDTGRCLYCDLVEAEINGAQRVIFESDRFVVFHPFASRVPFETWIAPKEHQPSFSRASIEELMEFAHVLRRVLRGLYQGIGDPNYNYIIHSAPTGDENKDYYLWHLQILPRLSAIAGFELGSGIFITSMIPEESAAFMRDVLASLE